MGCGGRKHLVLQWVIQNVASGVPAKLGLRSNICFSERSFSAFPSSSASQSELFEAQCTFRLPLSFVSPQPPVLCPVVRQPCSHPVRRQESLERPWPLPVSNKSGAVDYSLLCTHSMEAIAVAPPRVSTLPSPPMERKSPVSRASSAGRDRQNLDSPKEEASIMSGDRRSKQSPSPANSPAHSPKRTQDEQKPSVDDYEKGLVVCGTCGEGVPFRDPQSGGFTLRLWDMHRDQCRLRHDPRPEPIVFTPETTVDSMANPPLKKRRAKRTEEERIEYLRSDPYVAQFEPYRVLCGSCNKWIRLRPNSTYCSIPWDAHRKSCLSKKAYANARDEGAAEGQVAILRRDPDVRMVDVDRVMCARCDRWIPIRADDTYYALQTCALPVDHRSADVGIASPGRSAMNGISGVAIPNGHTSASGGAGHPPVNRLHSSITSVAPSLSSKSRAPAPSLGSLPAPVPFARTSGGSPYATPTSMASGSYASGPDCSPPTALRELASGPSALASHDARRKNAEQRAAALKADPLLREVEPNRVFCGLCGKWVQLRQDSSFCAYPWHQHRSKCLARYQRRQEKVHGYSPHGPYDSRYGGYSGHGASRYNGDLDADGSFDDDLESEDDRPLPRHRSLELDSPDEDGPSYSHRQRYEKASGHPYARPPPPPSYAPSSSHGSSSGRYKLSAQAAAIANHYKYDAPSYALRRAPSVDDMDDVSMDEDADGEHDVDVEMDEEPGRDRRRQYEYVRRQPHDYHHGRGSHQSRQRAEDTSAKAELRSASGRLAFISTSVEHLFKTTYDHGDELSIGALVNYLNAAMPADKHDDFDVQEVTRAAAALAKTGVLVQEGDRLRPVN
ncbi:uncharacterized protein FOMMEDRAFT_148505 [Fomitiporia mediterranea MF3/22]|uniref:uncharacterized protein n=1 Tax=Fomitiporia mediterranea (strain MF3/22) TaxID=694068 RepID=UPI0004408A5F|nr:uncharacterized protein FOMMEDRAFT_148505 [Fomitiporia mediterranea MF3/22]EJD00255.1 hypothetical protein FOMMEDRAFT_148505 [Fomitiporia mediterranea MF3/22]